LREDLDCRNEDDWPDGLDGNPADPWVLQYLLPLENPPSGEVVIFVASSFGGRRAISELCDAYTKRAKRGHHGQPIIKLATTEMPTKKFGKVPRPLFEIDGWDQGGDTEVIPPTDPGPTLREEMDDDLPEYLR
jgi:hypothetical protein